ncbi:UNKNOWN [Stylonychia lemnae]|uniref:Uncharacterized protein n=1 Tax=Stylonychia lemnae TaxID=5949 RepID=A0A078ARD1_STYLE|nr:UNKNOWN [Stylonychia lemnae]|eukprot:CDW83782.1 UNKNOWN [Stylonychia lemnae]
MLRPQLHSYQQSDANSIYSSLNQSVMINSSQDQLKAKITGPLSILDFRKIQRPANTSQQVTALFAEQRKDSIKSRNSTNGNNSKGSVLKSSFFDQMQNVCLLSCLALQQSQNNSNFPQEIESPPLSERNESKSSNHIQFFLDQAKRQTFEKLKVPNSQQLLGIQGFQSNFGESLTNLSDIELSHINHDVSHFRHSSDHDNLRESFSFMPIDSNSHNLNIQSKIFENIPINRASFEEQFNKLKYEEERTQRTIATIVDVFANDNKYCRNSKKHKKQTKFTINLDSNLGVNQEVDSFLNYQHHVDSDDDIQSVIGKDQGMRRLDELFNLQQFDEPLNSSQKSQVTSDQQRLERCVKILNDKPQYNETKILKKSKFKQDQIIQKVQKMQNSNNPQRINMKRRANFNQSPNDKVVINRNQIHLKLKEDYQSQVGDSSFGSITLFKNNVSSSDKKESKQAAQQIFPIYQDSEFGLDDSLVQDCLSETNEEQDYETDEETISDQRRELINESKIIQEICGSLNPDALRIFIVNSSIEDRVARPCLFDRQGKMKDYQIYSTERDEDGLFSAVREDEIFNQLYDNDERTPYFNCII